MRSLRLCRLFGIDVRVYPSFLVLPLFFAFWYGKDYGPEVGLRAFTLVILVFACVLGHELTHSLVARRFGIAVPQIDLIMIGGVARMQRIPRKSSEEFLISVVGPLFNFALTALLYWPMEKIIGHEALWNPSFETWPQMFANALWANPVLGVFNLIPAFPMDGGRMLRAALSSRISYLKATQISVNLGRFFAILFALFGIFQQRWMLAAIAFFVYRSAGRELAQVRYEDFLTGRNEHSTP